VTYRPVVERRDHVLVSDAKFVEGVFFFDGEKKTGSYLAVPYAVADEFLVALPAKGGEGGGGEEEEEETENDDGVEKEKTEKHLPLVAGVLCADTFCSFDDEGERRELKDHDHLPLFRSAALVMGERMAAARTRLLTIQRARALELFQQVSGNAATVLDAALVLSCPSLLLSLSLSLSLYIYIYIYI
jgi:hypothetical protein